MIICSYKYSGRSCDTVYDTISHYTLVSSPVKWDRRKDGSVEPTSCHKVLEIEREVYGLGPRDARKETPKDVETSGELGFRRGISSRVERTTLL